MVAGASSWRPRAGLDWRLRERRVPRLARLRLQREVEEFLYGEEAPRATRVSGLRGAPRLLPGRFRARGTSYGFVKHFGELSRRLPQMLPRHRRQVIGLVVGDPAAPQHEDDLEPLRGERPEGVVMPVAASAAPVVVRAGPFALLKRLKRELVDGLAQVHVAGVPEHHEDLLAAAVGDGHGAGMALEMAEGLPAPGRVPELSIEPGNRGPAPAARQGRCPCRGRHPREKIGDRLPIRLDRAHGDVELRAQRADETGLDPDD